ncbi:MAG: type II toxin-antitoxin system VapC family toxin [Bacteroidales bacterium]|nr:type II toxin-antitoxin system VapC family toxin [Bacteroidales bacterium]
MAENYLIDSNVLIDFLADKLPQKGAEFVNDVLEKSFKISVISYVEVLGFNEKVEKQEALESFMSMAEVFFVDEKIAKQTIKLRKQTKLKLPDAFITATAIVNDFVLITRNKKDFGRIDQVKIVNPHEF